MKTIYLQQSEIVRMSKKNISIQKMFREALQI